MFFDWKIQLIRDLKDDTIFYQGIRLPCKNDQGHCNPTTRTQSTIVWFHEDTCTTFQGKICRNTLLNPSLMIK